MTLNCSLLHLISVMLEALASFFLPVAKEILLTAAGALLAYTFNKLQAHFFGA